MARALPYRCSPKVRSVHWSKDVHGGDPDMVDHDTDPDTDPDTKKHKSSFPDYLLSIVKTLPESLTPSQYDTAIDFIQQNADVFSKHEHDLGLTQVLTMGV